MFHYDFSNHQNRFIRLEDMPEDYMERICAAAAADPFYPRWHLAPPCGLTNDPCGLFEQNGVHYIFHQWFPAGPVHGLKYWRLLTTRDFVNYKACGPVLTPELPFDDHGCYTGMALPMPAGAANEGGLAQVFYTGIAGEKMEAAICEARMTNDGMRDRRVVVTRDPGISDTDFRDPCVWRRADEACMLVGSRSPEGVGQLLLYRCGSDGLWGAGRPLKLRPCGLDVLSFGYMLECPNYFDVSPAELGDGAATDAGDDACALEDADVEGGEKPAAGVLVFSPMGIASSNKYDFKNVFSVVYAVGAPLDAASAEFSCDTFYELDKGFDFYAPQVYRDEAGRRVLFGWLGNSKSAYPTDSNDWAHMLTCPREVRVMGDRLSQWPVGELEALRGVGERVEADGWTEISLDPDAISLDLDGSVDGVFSWELGNEAGDMVRFRATADEYELDRSRASHLYADRFGQIRYARRLDAVCRVRLMLDTSSLELFCDGGKTVFTSRVFIDRPTYLRVHGISGMNYPLAAILQAKPDDTPKRHSPTAQPLAEMWG